MNGLCANSGVNRVHGSIAGLFTFTSTSIWLVIACETCPVRVQQTYNNNNNNNNNPNNALK